MTDTVETNDVTPSADEQSEPKVVSKRGRRLLIAIILVLLLSLIAVTIGLLNFVLPRGEIAKGDDAGGLEWVKSIYGWGSTSATQFISPREVNISPDGTIWVTDTGYTNAVGFTPEGKLSKIVGKSAKEPIVGLGPLAEGPDGAMFIGEPEMDRVRVFGADGSDKGMFRVPNPVDITYRDGIMAIGTKFGVSLVNPADGIPTNVIGTFGKGDGQFDNANGVAIGADGTVFIADTYNNRLSAYNRTGKRKWIVSTGAPRNDVSITGAADMNASIVSTVPAGLQLPSDIAVDGNGRLVVVDPFDFSISVFDSADGKFIAKYGAYGQKDGQLAYPTSIAYDAQRDWFAVADSENMRVQIFRIPGSGRSDVLATARRQLSGPIRACLVPLILILIAVIAYLIVRARRKKAEKAKAAQAGSALSDDDAPVEAIADDAPTESLE